MMNRPLISVIVPVFNTAAYLDKCLGSICGQTYDNLEILCVDDGSTDDSLSILYRWAEKDRRIIIIHQENAGLSAARNAALDKATGDFVTGVDSDDFIEPDTYEAVARAIDDEVDMVTFGTILVSENGEKHIDSYWQHVFSGKRAVTRDTIEKNNVAFWNKVFRRSLIEAFHVRFPNGLLYEDNVFYFEYVVHARYISFIKKGMYNYLHRSGSIMNDKETYSLRAFTHCRILEIIFLHYREYELLKQWGDLYLWVFALLYDQPVLHIPHKRQGEIRHCFREMVKRQKMEQFFPGLYPVSHVLSDSWWRRLFFWRNRVLKIYRFFGFPVLKILQTNEGVEFSLLGFKWQEKTGIVSFS